ncbi:MAG: hypothetical protein WBL44_15805 [Nitrososphaeraceae archaeon]
MTYLSYDSASCFSNANPTAVKAAHLITLLYPYHLSHTSKGGSREDNVGLAIRQDSIEVSLSRSIGDI